MYLDDLIEEEGYGNSRAGVAKNLVWRTIEELISKGIIDRRKSLVLKIDETGKENRS